MLNQTFQKVRIIYSQKLNTLDSIVTSLVYAFLYTLYRFGLNSGKLKGYTIKNQILSLIHPIIFLVDQCKWIGGKKKIK